MNIVETKKEIVLNSDSVILPIIRAIVNKINKYNDLDDVSFNQMAELGYQLNIMGKEYGPKGIIEVIERMQLYTEERSQEKFTYERMLELIRLARA